MFSVVWGGTKEPARRGARAAAVRLLACAPLAPPGFGQTRASKNSGSPELTDSWAWADLRSGRRHLEAF